MRRGVVIVGLVGALVVAAAVVFVVRRDGDEPFVRAVALVEDRDGFDTGIEAGETLARVGELLLDAARNCRDDRGGRDRSVAACQARSSASAYAQVLAVHVLRCTAPGRFEARARMASYLEDVAAAAGVAAGGRDRVPQPPGLPDC